MKKTNLERHYSTKHARQSELQGQLRKDKINALDQSLGAQQAAFTRPNLEWENIVHALCGEWVIFIGLKKVRPPRKKLQECI